MTKMAEKQILCHFFAYDGFSGKEVGINVSLNQDIECCSIK